MGIEVKPPLAWVWWNWGPVVQSRRHDSIPVARALPWGLCREWASPGTLKG